ncbi:hypothetical protein CY34DRAFT_214395 [Suillus luteus UH-Slu-Lm8-n1]|uniref:DUF6533 domain-containing protein n=1 Tax=Suillus luteus UH-Slu-Lm8-n1 TaxID=930992 RepID=A0A0D0BDA4_9AGAM|nr:hypothetical protein CY34DRAFT_214395 [Suillus luteus UH-Slu-Lm8-n1]
MYGYQYMYMALATFWAYDYICLLDEEWTFLLRSRWMKGKILYIIARHAPFFFITTDLYLIFAPNENFDKCRVLINISSCFGVMAFICSECLFVLRTNVLCQNYNRIVRIAVLTMLFAVIVISIGLDVATIATSYFVTNAIPGIAVCYWSSRSVQYSMSYILFFVSQLGLVSLTLIRVIQSWRMAECHLYIILVKNNMFYYACGLVLSAINVLAPLLFSYSTYPFEDLQVFVLAILATRMHLHLWYDQHIHSSPQTLEDVHESEMSFNLNQL